MSRLLDQLYEYGESDYYGFHMPGHKRNMELYGGKLPLNLDITEIDGFDDLHHAKSVLKEAQERAAKVFHAGETHFLINGSSVGIISAILGCTNRGDKILVARNCHKSIYAAIYLNDLRPIYLYPRYYEESQLNGTCRASNIQSMLEEHSDIKAVVLVSPTYDGVVADISRIKEMTHAYGVPLIVDEAHGAHLGFHDYFPENSNTAGADVVIHSVHKMLPSLTQTALLHINGPYVEPEKIRRYLDILQSSSPSYVLMASIDACVDLMETKGKELMAEYAKNLSELRENLRDNLKVLKMVRRSSLNATYDPSKIVISTKNAPISSRELYDILLEKYHLQMEMAAGSYVLAMTSLADTKEGFDRLYQALMEIDTGLKPLEEPAQESWELPKLTAVCSIAEASEKSGKECISLPLEESAGYVSREFAYVYPPGIPFIVMGERIEEKVIRLLMQHEEAGFVIEGLKEKGKIEVWKDE